MKTEKLSIFISIVLISLLALGAVSAADDTAATDDAPEAIIEEVQTIDNTITNDDMSYESSDIIVNTTGDSGDLDKDSKANLASTKLSEGETSSFTNLANNINDAPSYLSLSGNYAYDSTIDGDYVTGIYINKDITINGGGTTTIDGRNVARIFNISNGHNVVLHNITFTNGNIEQGGAIYNDGNLVLKDCKFANNAAQYGGAIYNTENGVITGDSDFTSNVAVYRGGAIYSEGSVALSDSVIDGNDITYRAKNDDNGGAAIYNNGGTLTLDKVQVTNNLLDIVIRDGNDGHLINAAIFTSGDATITDSVISNNSGSWGGGIYVTNGATLDVSGTTFEKNMATFGAAIYDEGAKVIVNNCDFNENHCEGIGSAGTSSTQAAAILVMSEGASATITDSRFNKNSAKTGGAVSISQASGDVLIEGCTFTENTASYEGGAIYNYAADGAELTVKDSTFTDNTAANWGDAISNDAGLKLEGNTISGNVNTAIGNWLGTIDTQVKVKILDGQEHTVTNPTIDLTATVTDDNGNKINDHAFTFTVGAEEVPATYDATEGIYKATYTFKNPGTYTVSTDSYTLEDVTDSVITFKSSLSSLKALIDENTNGTLDLTYGFSYDDELDSAIKTVGIAINKNIIINGNGVTLSGADLARLFEINSGFTLTLNNLIISNFVGNYGPAVFVHNGATLYSNNVNYNNNIANANGGAIYSEYGNLVIIGSTFTNNEAKGTYGTSTGVGSAIYDFAGINPGTTTYITDSTFTNNAGTGTKAGVYVDNAVITGSTFTNTVIFAMRKASISNDVFDNEGNDIHLSTNTGFVFYDGTGDLPVLSKATINYTGTSFQGLQDIITNSDYGTKTLNIGLHNDITKLADEEFANGIVIDKKVLINGLGHTLDVNGQGKAFYISEGAELSLLDMNIVGDGTSAIVNDGILKDYNPTKPITFTNAGEYPIDNDEGIITINFNTKTFTQLNSVISLISGGTINTSSTKVTKGDDEKETFADGITITQKDLSIISSNKNYQRTIDADNSGRIFNVADGASLTLKNITLQNGNAADGGAVYVNDGGKLVADSTKFLNNKATYSGGAIYATGATVSLDNCILDNNDATDHSTNNDTGGAAIYAEDSTVTISKTKVTNNGDKTLNRTKGDLINGVLNLHDSTTTITDSVFENNTGIYGGAITAETTKDEGVSKLTISGTNFTSNAAYTGGAVYVADTEFDISDSIFDANNKASGEGSTGYTAGGGALVIMSGSEGSLDNVTVKNSHASQGGAIDLENSQVTITGSKFESNSADGWAGAIYATGNSALTVEDSSFKNNTAAAATIVTFGATTATIKDSNFTDNYDTNNWGVVTVYGTGDVNIEGSKFTKDVDDTYTVDVYVVDDAKVSVKDSTFDTNSYYSIFAQNGELTLEGNDIESDYVPIYTVADAEIVSKVKAVISENETYYIESGEIAINATLTDDMGNMIRDANFNFVVYKDDEIAFKPAATFDGQKYTATFAPTVADVYLVTLDYPVEEVQTATYYFGSVVVIDFPIPDIELGNEGFGLLNVFVYDPEAEDQYDGEQVETTANLIFKDAEGIVVLEMEGVGTSTSFDTAVEFDSSKFAIGKYTVTVVLGDNFVLADDKDTFEFEVTPILLDAIVEGSEDISYGDKDTHTITLGKYDYELDEPEFIQYDYDGTAIVSVYDDDELVKEIEVAIVDGEGTISFENIPAGIYFYEITLDDETYAISRDEDYEPYELAIAHKKGTYTDLKVQIEDAIAQAELDGEEIVYIELPYNFAYDAEYDGEAFLDGIEISDSIVIDGNNMIISGEEQASIFTVAEGAVLTISDAFLAEGNGINGGAVYVSEGSIFNANNVNFVGNKASNGGAIYSEGTTTIVNSFFNKNDPEYGGAIYVAAGETLVKDNTAFIENNADFGGAIYVDSGASLTVEDSTFSKNTASSGSAIYADYGSELTISGSEFTENIASGNYGAVYIAADDATVSDSTFTKNTGGNGGAIFWTGDNGELTNSEFTENTATGSYSGGAVFVFGDGVEINGCAFEENTAANAGGAVIVFNQGNIGGHEVIITDCDFISNNAATGGAVYWTGESGTLSDSLFKENEATANGAAILATGTGFSVINSVFIENSAATDGAIYLAGNDATIKEDKFIRSAATMGAIVLDGATITVSDSLFSTNAGMPVHYNILNSGTITSIKDTTFETIVPTIEAEDSYVYGETITITGNFDWGVQQPAITMKYTINGVEGTTTVLNGEYKILIDNQPDVGDYTIVISSFTDDKGNFYEVNTAQATFAVVKASPSLEVTGDTVSWGETSTVTVKVADGETPLAGKVIVTVVWDVDSATQVVTLNETGEGEATFKLTDVAPGSYDIIATFIPDEDNYKSVVNNTEKLTITDSIESNLEVVAPSEIEDGTTLDMTATLTDGMEAAIEGKTLTYTVDGGEPVTTAATGEDGSVVISIEDLAFGEHTIVVKFDDGVHAVATQTVTVNVLPKKGTYTDLQYIIDNDEDGIIELPYNFAFDEEYDLANFEGFIDGVKIDKQIAINGNGHVISGKDSAAILYLTKDADLTLSDVYLLDGFSSVGSAIYAPYGSKLYINKVTVMDNENKGPYGAVYIGADNAIVVDSKFINNKGGNGAAIFWTGDNGQLADSTFTGNNATDAYSGGAVFAFGDTITIEGCTFEENTAAVNGGAVIVYNQGNIGGHNTIVRDSVFTDNAAQSGAGIYWTGETGTIDNCTFEGNDATVNGAAIIATGNGMTIKNSEFTGNTAERDGAIYLAGNTVTLTGDKFIRCQATQSAVIVDGATISVEDSVFEYNTGAPVHYNILNAGTITSIEGSTFGFIEPTIVAEDSYVYGQPIEITGKFDWGVQQPAITMKYTINGFEGTTTVINGEYNILIDTQPDVGDYTMVISSFSDDNGNFYEVNTAQATFSVVKATPILEVEGDDYLMPHDTATVGITLTDALEEGIEGIVIVTVDGKDYVVYTDENGEAELEIPDLAAAEYPITAKFIGNDKYNEVVNDTEVIDFMMHAVEFDIVIENIIYGEDLVVIVDNVTDADGNPLTGTVMGNIINEDGAGAGLIVYVEDGYGTRTIKGLDADTYEVTATFYDDDGEYISETVTFNITVDKAAAVVDASADHFVYGTNGTLEITVTDVNDNVINGTAFIEIDGEIYALDIDVEDGKATVNLTNFDVGSYVAEVSFTAGNYRDVSYITHFNVTKATPTISIEDAEAVWGEAATIKFNVTGVDGAKLNGEAVVTVSWDVDGVSQLVTVTDGEGQATFKIDGLVAPGTYDVTVKFIGDRNYADATQDGAKLTLTGSKDVTVTVDVEAGDCDEVTNVTVTVVDVSGSPVGGATVSYTIDDGEAKEATLDENGTVVIPVEDLDAGKHNITVSFNDGVHEAKEVTEDFTIDKAVADFNYAVAEVVYRDDLVVEFTDVVDADGNPLSGIATVFYLDNNGQEVSATGDIEAGSGSVKLVDLDAGVYELAIVFENNNYIAIPEITYGIVNKADPEITIELEAIEYGAKPTIEIEIRGYHEEAINDTVTVLIDDEEIGTFTTVNGKVSVPVDKFYEIGTYIVDVDYAGDDNYNSATNSAKLVVTKATPVVTVEGAEVEWGSPATIKVTVSDSEGMPVEGTAVVRVSWIVDGVDQYIDITEGSGEATFEISGLVAPGEYDVKVMFLGGRNYNDVNNTDAKLVLTTPAAVNLNVNADAGEFGEDTNITVTLTDTAYNPMEGSVVTVYVDDKELTKATIGEDGTVTVPISDLTAGEHTVKVVLDDGVHDLAEKEISFTVDPTSGANIKFTGEDVEFGNNYPIKITVVDPEDNPLDGKAIVVLDGNAIAEVDIVAGAGEYNITGLDVGSYYLEVIFNNDNYLPTNYGDKINVTRATPTVKVEDAEVEWGTPATIKVTVYDSEGMPIEGNAVVSVSWIVDGVDQYIDITEGSGEANFEISGFVAPGEYDVTVFYLAGRNYNNASATAKLTLTAPKDINVDVDVDAGDYGEDTNVTVTVTDKANAPVANAPVTVVVDGKEYNAITDENGTVTVPVSGLEAGDHNITVKVDDGVHTPAEETATATVDPASGADIQATVEPGHAGQDSIVNVSAKDPEDNPVKGNAIVIVDGEPYTEVPLDENGTASVPIKDLPTGEHTVEVVFDNPNYLPSSYTTHFDVKAQDTKLVVAVDKESIVYGDGAVTATIGLSADGKPISGVVEVILNGDPQNVTVTNGLATVKFNNLAAANYTVIGNFAGTSVYTGATDSANFNVERKATKFNYQNMKTTAVNPNIDGRIGEYFYFQLLDEDGKALANKPVVIGFNGKTYNKTTNETGWARLQINLARAFRYTFAINFAGDENYTSAFNVALINVTTQAPKLTTSSKTYAASAKTKTLTATFKTKSGNAVSGRQITFTVNGKSYSAKTNAKGVATVKVSLSKKGTYSFTAKFAGDDTYSAVSKSAKLTIK